MVARDNNPMNRLSKVKNGGFLRCWVILPLMVWLMLLYHSEEVGKVLHGGKIDYKQKITYVIQPYAEGYSY